MIDRPVLIKNGGEADLPLRHWRGLLVAITVAALLIRFWGIWYGLPFSYFNDEYHEVMRALELGAGGFNIDRVGKGGFYFLLFVEYGIYFVWLKLTGAVHSTLDFAHAFVRDPSPFYLMGRASAALIGGLTVSLVFFLSRRVYTTIAGLYAALFLAVNTLHADLSRCIGVDVPMTFLATLSIYFGLLIVESGQRKHYLLAALFAALATTTKLSGIVVLLPLLIAHAYCGGRTRSGFVAWIGSANLWLAALVFIGVLLATNPGIVRLPEMIVSLYSPSIGADDFAAEDELVNSVRPNLFVYYATAIQASMGWPLFLLSLAGAGYALLKRTPADLMLLSFGFVSYLLISITSTETLYYPRYTLPIIVALTVLAGRLVALATERIASRRAVKTALLLSVCLAIPVGATSNMAYVITQADTRTLAKDWIEANVPAGSRVMIEGLKIGPVKTTVPLRQTNDAIDLRILHWKVKEPKQARFLELQRAVNEGVGYDLELVRPGAFVELDDYIARGVEYFVIRPEYLLTSRRMSSGSVRLVHALRTDPRVALVMRIERDESKRLGPTVEVYRLLPRSVETSGSADPLKSASP